MSSKGLNIPENEDIDKEILEKEFKKKTLQEWTEIFDKLDACVSPVLELNEAPMNEHNKFRNSFLKVDENTSIPTMAWLPNDSTSRNYVLPKIGLLLDFCVYYDNLNICS